MFVYLIAFLCVVLFGLLCKRIKNGASVFTFLSFIILGTLVAFRSSNVGIDTETYIRIFNNMTAMNWASRIEKGFQALCVFLHELHGTPQTLLIVTGYFCVGVTCYFIYKNSRNPLFSMILYIGFNYYFTTFNLMRQAIALSICLIAQIIKEKGQKRAYLLFVVACLFHYSAIPVFICEFFISRDFSKKAIRLIMIGGGLVYITLPSLINLAIKIFPAYGVLYSGTSYLERNVFGTLFECTRILAVIIVLYVADKRNINNYYFRAILIGLFVYVFATRYNVIARIAPYFTVYEIIALPNAVGRMKNGRLIKLIIIAVAVMYFSIVAIYRPGWHGAIPYEFWSN